MKLLVFLLLISLSGQAYACVEVISKDFEFVNENSKTVGIKYGGVVQNLCNVSVVQVRGNFTVIENYIPRQVFTHNISQYLAPGEMAGFNFEDEVKYSIDDFTFEIFHYKNG